MCGEEGKGGETVKPEKTSWRRGSLSEGRESVSDLGHTMDKGHEVGISLVHSRNTQEIKWAREGLKRNFQAPVGNKVSKEISLSSGLRSHFIKDFLVWERMEMSE